MYLTDDLVDIVLTVNKIRLRSIDHRTVLLNTVVGNAQVHSAEAIKEICDVLNKFPRSKIRTITVREMKKLFPAYL
jgi:hypothetical protein